MARYKNYNYDQVKLLPVSYAQQVLPGTFEFTLNQVIDEIDLSMFDARYQNDETGAPAYDPRILLKIILFAYAKIKAFLVTHAENVSPTGTIRQSNITDPDSAKMKTSHGVLQGYNGVAAVDSKHQVIVHTEAFGEGQEHHLLAPMIEGCRAQAKALGEKTDVFKGAKLVVDAGFHTEANMKYVFAEGIDAYIADKQMRKRDPRFASASRHKVRHRKERRQRSGAASLFRPADFTL